MYLLFTHIVIGGCQLCIVNRVFVSLDKILLIVNILEFRIAYMRGRTQLLA